MDVKNLIKLHKERKQSIKKRLEDFKKIQKKPDKDIFAELAFCVLTPQSKAFNCWNAVLELRKSGLLCNGKHNEIGKVLQRKVRFHNTKAKHIVYNRRLLDRGLKNTIINGKSNEMAREWLVENVKGYGFKEASHFLRNIGYRELAILDRHILKYLVEFGVIEKVPKSLTKKNYMEIEEKFKQFSGRVGIPMDELDLLFWSLETGEIFK